ncbi:MAG: DUF3341 domain-containing protein [Rhodospirillales bacterium]|nr:DUF3341 domain-containing protein [Alphaproteobacteria bacterium]MCB9986370.1 DUF3341 domain-containing protein [Rhodospirillales bacterium]USO07081.1 MAG: DUF3341 domain-containing protein [Rhodospirillales bacterium]
MSKVITATFKTREAAEVALHRLEALGIGDSQVSVVVSENTREQAFDLKRDNKSDEGIAYGGVAGGLVGAVLGALLTAGAVAIPAAGIVVSGWLVAGAAGAGAGALTGGFVGGLIGTAIPEYEAQLHEGAVREGAILLAVRAADHDQAHQIKTTLEETDAHNIAA